VLRELAINFHFCHDFKRFIDTRGPSLSNNNASVALEAVEDKECLVGGAVFAILGSVIYDFLIGIRGRYFPARNLIYHKIMSCFAFKKLYQLSKLNS